MSKTGGIYKVFVGQKVLEATLRGRFKQQDKTRILVGDKVVLSKHDDGSLTIEELSERKSLLRRRSPGNRDAHSGSERRPALSPCGQSRRRSPPLRSHPDPHRAGRGPAAPCRAVPSALLPLPRAARSAHSVRPEPVCSVPSRTEKYVFFGSRRKRHPLSLCKTSVFL